MLRIIKLTYSGTLLLPDGPDPFGPWTCLARRHAKGYQVNLNGTLSAYHPTPTEAVKEAAETAMCAPVANLRVVEA